MFREVGRKPEQKKIQKVRGEPGFTTLMCYDPHHSLEEHFPGNFIPPEVMDSSFSPPILSPAQAALCCPLLAFACFFPGGYFANWGLCGSIKF